MPLTSTKPSRAISLLILLLLASGLLPCPDSLSRARLPTAPLGAPSVLFVGNSFTSGGNLPALVQLLSLRAGHPIATTMIAPGGRWLAWHAKNPETSRMLHSQHWDYVVLQDCSTCPLDYLDLFDPGVDEMVQQVRDVKATPILYMTWADRLKGEDLAVIEAAYRRKSVQWNVALAPVGLAWRAVGQKFPELSLYEGDNHHASLTGALVSSAVFLRFFGVPEPDLGEIRMPSPATYIYELFFPHYQSYSDESTTAKVLRTVYTEAF